MGREPGLWTLRPFVTVHTPGLGLLRISGLVRDSGFKEFAY